MSSNYIKPLGTSLDDIEKHEKNYGIMVTGLSDNKPTNPPTPPITSEEGEGEEI